MTPRTQQRERALYHYYQLEDLVPEDHILRQIDRAVDFSFAREAVWDCYDHTNGRPGTYPELIVRMILIGYFYGLSENRLRSEVTMRAAYRLFCHMDSFDDPVPDRSTINKLRNVKWAETGLFKTIMRRIVQQCSEVGLVGGKRLSVDGTQIRADASVKSIEPIGPPISLDEFLKGMGLGEEPASPAPTEHHPEDKDFHGEKWSNDTHHSTTDPENQAKREQKVREAKARNAARFIAQTNDYLQSQALRKWSEHSFAELGSPVP